MGSFPTMVVANEKGHRCVINERDFDPKRHTLWEDKAKPAPPPPPNDEIRTALAKATTIGALVRVAAKFELPKLSKQAKDVAKARAKLLEAVDKLDE